MAMMACVSNYKDILYPDEPPIDPDDLLQLVFPNTKFLHTKDPFSGKETFYGFCRMASLADQTKDMLYSTGNPEFRLLKLLMDNRLLHCNDECF